MSQSGEARTPGSRVVYLRLKIDADMGEVFETLSAVAPRKRSREATFYLRLGVERGRRGPAGATSEVVTIAHLPSLAGPAAPLPPAPAARDHLAGLPGIDD